MQVSRKRRRYWCSFGVKDAIKYQGFSITGQINSPVSGFDRTTGGAFLRDSRGHVYVAHSGKVGGGRSGIGKSAFVTAYRGKNWQTVIWPDKKETEMIVIGRVDGPHLQNQVAHFIREIERFKKNAVGRNDTSSGLKDKPTFKPEFSGRRKSYSLAAEIESQCDHGPIISALEAKLRQCGLKCANDTPRDLFVLSSKGRVQMLFEAKTDLSTSSVYGAVGQLMLHAAAEPNEPRRVFVAPGTPTKKTQLALKKLGIEVLTYKWEGSHPKFVKLKRLLQ
jgi:hypothetical protein